MRPNEKHTSAMSAPFLPAPLARRAILNQSEDKDDHRTAGESMSARELAERRAVVAEARRWLNTPYVHMGRKLGAGVDCATLLCEVFERAGLVPHITLEYYPPDWYLHRDEERYLTIVSQYARQVERAIPLPGDIALYKFGRCVSHGAIVMAWPIVIHAYRAAGRVCLADGTKSPLVARFHSFWSVWG